ncbi:unnamed protein product [Anisakis simplex]|uniref:Protein FAR1-RELATED SEQUENCE n=1 Tax=Anisakis simplex TaxID=6269 RepID=A0A0M3JZ64_ANISI|nr:unnamed protein product [Anisakis simplex]
MTASLDQLAAVAQFELSTKMQSIVDMYGGNVNCDKNSEQINENHQQWSMSNGDISKHNVMATNDNDAVNVTDNGSDTRSPRETSTVNTQIPIPATLSSSIPPDLPCSVIVPSSSLSDDTEVASHTPSSVGTSPSLSNESHHQHDVVSAVDSSSTTQQATQMKDLLKNETNDSFKEDDSDSLTQSGRTSVDESKQGVIATGARFNSFAEFEYAFDLWKQMYHHPFRVASSETLRQPDGTTNDTFKYRYIVYHCAHYGQPRMRESAPAHPGVCPRSRLYNQSVKAAPGSMKMTSL